ncbi:unnamed protein product [Meloidogyne enterolobii]|uniref:Uncharacterized protein n=1 Tax=Meloidogyne enterolobii TaxID=390850 RepID=A0ACB1A8X1_MELEN
MGVYILLLTYFCQCTPYTLLRLYFGLNLNIFLLFDVRSVQHVYFWMSRYADKKSLIRRFGYHTLYSLPIVNCHPKNNHEAKYE